MNIINRYRFLLLLGAIFLSLTRCGASNTPSEIEPPVNIKGNEWVIYEVNPGLFKQKEVFKGITSRLDEIKSMGVNVIWLMPIYEQGELHAFGSPYCVKDYKKVNENYGSLTELKSLVSSAQAKQMKVILDWVANHTSWDNAWIQNKAWYTQNAGGDIVSPPGMNWNDVADLNFSNSDMRKEMINAMKYWVTEAGIDGYRCDYAEGVPLNFWEEAIKELRDLKQGELIMLAEGGEAALFSVDFDLVYGWDFAYRLQDVYTGKINLKALYESHQKEYQGVPAGKQRMRYTTNHDMASENSPIQVYKGEKGAISAFVIASTMGGTPMIYSSQEIGYPTPLTFFTHSIIDWDSNPDYTSEYKSIMRIYANSEALKEGTLRTYDTGNVASYLRKSQNEEVLIMVNTTDQPIEVKVPIEFSHKQVKNLSDNSSETLPTVLELKPFQYKIWKI